MKTITALLLTVTSILGARAAQPAFGGLGTGSTTLSYYVISGKPAGTPMLSYVNATSDKAASVLKFYLPTVTLDITAASPASGTNVACVPAGVTNNDVVVLWSAANDTYQRVTVSSAVSTNIVASAALTTALSTGDRVYKMTSVGSIPCGATTIEKNGAGSGLFFGKAGQPTLIEVDGTSACAINLISGRYLQ